VVVLVTGAGGLIGSRLVPELKRAGHTVVRAVRRAPASGDEVGWTPETGALEPWRPLDAVVHLAGQGLATGRWTRALKQRAWSSRVDATRALVERLAAAPRPPAVMVCASGVGIYGDQGDRIVDESFAPGKGFLAALAQAWEGATESLGASGTRTVSLRLGIVLTREGGALRPLLVPARLGLGGPLGSGRQFWSWVAIDDVVAVILRALARPEIAGPVNLVAPEPVRQSDFARALGRVLKRPAFLPVPALALRVLLGEMADAQILSSTRAVPARLEQDGFRFSYPDLEGALRAALAV
jgi:uncharacterized protein (TIGR01777 family)